MALARHGGSCERGCGDQCGRQKLELRISISPLDMKAYGVGSTTEMEQRSTDQSNSFSRRFNAARGRRVASILTPGHQGDYRPRSVDNPVMHPSIAGRLKLIQNSKSVFN
jgi:hypothetical protein